MFATFLTVSGFVFWFILAAIVLVDALLLSREYPNDGWPVFLAVAALVATVAFTDAFTGFRVVTLLIGLGAYLAAGVGWSFWKWYGFLISARDDARKSFAANPGGLDWATFAAGRMPTAARNKQRLINWMALWPFSFSWWVLTWPRRAFVWLYDRLSTIFDRIAQRVFASLP